MEANTKIAVGMQNDQMLEVDWFKWVGNNTRISGRGSNVIKKVPHIKRWLVNYFTCGCGPAQSAIETNCSSIFIPSSTVRFLNFSGMFLSVKRKKIFKTGWLKSEVCETRGRKESWAKIDFCGTAGERKQWVKIRCKRTQTTLIIKLEQI